MKNHTPNPVDIHVGSRVRLRRILLGMSQDKLGRDLDLSFQQVQKYERGHNRIGSSRLYLMSQILNVPVSFFFDGMPPEVTGKAASGAETIDTAQMTSRETLELVRNYYKLEAGVRKSVFAMVKAIGRAEG